MKTGKSGFFWASVTLLAMGSTGRTLAADPAPGGGSAAGVTIAGLDESSAKLREAGLGGVSLNPMLKCLAAKIGGVAQISTGGVAPNCNAKAKDAQFACPIPQSKIDSVNALADNGIKALQACQIQANAATQELACLSESASALKAQLGLFNDTFQKEMNRFQTDMHTIEEVKADRTNQLKQATERLMGRPGSGSPGLKQVQANLEALSQQMEGDIQQFQSVNQTVDKMGQDLERQKKNLVASTAASCFQNDTDSSYVCNPNAGKSGGKSAAENGGTPTTAMDFLLCRAYQNEFIGSTGAIESGSAVEDRATVRKAQLKALLNDILSRLPKTGVPLNDAQNAQSMQDSAPISDKKALLTLLNGPEFAPRIAAFNTSRQDSSGHSRSFNMTNAVASAFGPCFKKGTDKLANDSSVSVAQFQIQEKRDRQVSEFNKLLGRYNQEFQKAKSAGTGLPTVVNLSDCKKNTPDGQLACLKGFRNATVDFLQADPTKNPIGLQTITLDSISSKPDPSTGKKPDIIVPCGSLNACVIELESAHNNLETKLLPQVALFKDKYAQTAFSSTQSFIQGMASQMSAQSNSLQQAINDLNTKLLGPMNLKTIALEPLEPKSLGRDANGLPTLEGKAGDLIGGLMTPPMMDLSKDPFGAASKSIGAATEGVATEILAFQSLKTQALAEAKKCRNEAFEDLKVTVDQVASGNCNYGPDACKPEQVRPLVSVLRQIDPNSGIDPTKLMDLSNTIENLCNPPAVSLGQDDNSRVTHNPGLCLRITTSLKGDIDRLRKVTGGNDAGLAN